MAASTKYYWYSIESLLNISRNVCEYCFLPKYNNTNKCINLLDPEIRDLASFNSFKLNLKIWLADKNESLMELFK